MPLTDRPLEVAPLLDEVASRTRGAAVLFLGSVRDRHAGKEVVGITYSAYEAMAERVLDAIQRELEAEAPGLVVRIVHRLGTLAAGEASIAIAAAAPRRDAAFAAGRRALERVKREVPIWKLERYADGTEGWREEESLVPGGSGSRDGGTSSSGSSSSHS